MAKEETKLNKTLYRLIILILKFIPYIIALGYAAATIAGFWRINLIALGYFVHLSILPWIFFILASFGFKFCIRHRLPLYYICVDDFLIVIDHYFTINITNTLLLLIHVIVIFLFIILFLYFTYK